MTIATFRRDSVLFWELSQGLATGSQGSAGSLTVWGNSFSAVVKVAAPAARFLVTAGTLNLKPKLELAHMESRSFGGHGFPPLCSQPM
jgi:hypothetical protein